LKTKTKKEKFVPTMPDHFRCSLCNRLFLGSERCWLALTKDCSVGACLKCADVLLTFASVSAAAIADEERLKKTPKPTKRKAAKK